MRFLSSTVKLGSIVLIVGFAILSNLSKATVQALPSAQAIDATSSQAVATMAATNTPTEPRTVQVTTADGLTLKADYWVLSTDQTPGSGAPAVVYIYQYGSSWQGDLPLVEPLLQAGYNVLSVDRRPEVPGDIQTWLDWLRDQPGVRPDAISTLGPGIGGTLALIGCANDKKCMSAIAVSPRLDGFGLPLNASALVESALSDGLSDRSALLIASEKDSYSQAKEMIPFTTGEISLRLYAGSDHGEFLFSQYSKNADRVKRLIISWLNEHMPTTS